MKASTFKLDGKLLRAIASIKPSTKSLSAFVREVLENEVKRKKLQAAGAIYMEFLSENPAERDWLEEWQKAPLESPPRGKKKK